jgi:hypothetical protein
LSISKTKPRQDVSQRHLHHALHPPPRIIKPALEYFSRNHPISRIKLSQNPTTNLAWLSCQMDRCSNTIRSPTSLLDTQSHPVSLSKNEAVISSPSHQEAVILSLEHFILYLPCRAPPHGLRRCQTLQRLLPQSRKATRPRHICTAIFRRLPAPYPLWTSSTLHQSVFLSSAEASLFCFRNVDSASTDLPVHVLWTFGLDNIQLLLSSLSSRLSLIRICCFLGSLRLAYIA